MNYGDKRERLRALGTILVLIGLVLVSLGIVGFLESYPACAVNACPSVYSTYYAGPWAEIIVGLGMIALGAIMIAFSMRIET